MILDFTVRNYRSIKEAATLSFVAQSHKARESKSSKKRKFKSDDEIAKPYQVEGRRDLQLLPVLGIFGANASGKTNILRALDDLVRTIVFSNDSEKRNRLSNFVPHLLNSKSSKMPTFFQLRIVRENNIYTYTIEANQEQVVFEKLEYIPSSSKIMRNRLLFEREWNGKLKKYSWKNGEDFGETLKPIQISIKPERLFINILLSSFDIEIVEPFASFFRQYWAGVVLNEVDSDINLAAALANSNSKMKTFVRKLIKEFDTGISDFEIEKVKKQDSSGSSEFKVWVSHKTDKSPVKWELSQESFGTQCLFSIAAKLMDAHNYSNFMLVDELGSNIHPNITRKLIRIFQNEKTNPRRAQLIFTSHDNTLQRNQLLRRDQIWFTQKNEKGGTELYSLSDFSPRNDLSIDKAYLDGRFGAVPVLPNDEELLLPN